MNNAAIITNPIFRSKNVTHTAIEPEIDKERYCFIRNLSWNLLINSCVNRAPIDIHMVVRKSGVVIYNYQDDADIMEIIDPRNYRLNNESFCGQVNGQNVICYNKNYPEVRYRYSIAHELAHIKLGHTPEMSETMSEIEAQILASRILMPACILRACNIQSPVELASLFHVSEQSAKIRFKRYHELLERNKFKTSVEEQQLMHQFSKFTKHYLQIKNCRE